MRSDENGLLTDEDAGEAPLDLNGKAGEEKLADLHGVLADIFITRIRTRTATPSDLNAARQFLKDNGITCDGPRSPTLRSIADDLPDELPDMHQ